MDHFEFDISDDEENSLVLIRASGPVSREGFIKMVSSAREVSKIKQQNLLYDMRSMRLPPDIMLSEILAFVKTSASLNDSQSKRFRSASLVVRELLSDEIWEVYRYAAKTAGLEWAFFTDHDEAIAWLKESG